MFLQTLLCDMKTSKERGLTSEAALSLQTKERGWRRVRKSVDSHLAPLSFPTLCSLPLSGDCSLLSFSYCSHCARHRPDFSNISIVFLEIVHKTLIILSTSKLINYASYPTMAKEVLRTFGFLHTLNSCTQNEVQPPSFVNIPEF